MAAEAEAGGGVSTSGRCRLQWELGRWRACPFDFVRGGEVTSSCLTGWHVRGFTRVLVTQMRPPRAAALLSDRIPGSPQGPEGWTVPVLFSLHLWSGVRPSVRASRPSAAHTRADGSCPSTAGRRWG